MKNKTRLRLHGRSYTISRDSHRTQQAPHAAHATPFDARPTATPRDAPRDGPRPTHATTALGLLQETNWRIGDTDRCCRVSRANEWTAERTQRASLARGLSARLRGLRQGEMSPRGPPPHHAPLLLAHAGHSRRLRGHGRFADVRDARRARRRRAGTRRLPIACRVVV